jgi:hypothetical protein
MTGSAKQSILSFCGGMDCFVAALLAMTRQKKARTFDAGLFRLARQEAPMRAA